MKNGCALIFKELMTNLNLVILSEYFVYNRNTSNRNVFF